MVISNIFKTLTMIDKNCLNCGNIFYGRSNRTYCSQSCKSAINNFRIAERDEGANKVARMVKTNRRILINLHGIYGNMELPSVIVDKTRLDKKWYNWASPDGTQQVFLDYCLRRLPNSNYLISKLPSK